jgi:hypothetical protein
MSYTVPATFENRGYAGLRHCLLGFAVSYINYVPDLRAWLRPDLCQRVSRALSWTLHARSLSAPPDLFPCRQQLRIAQGAQ